MYNRLLGHLNNNNILFEEKFGFGQNLTTKKATYELIKLYVLKCPIVGPVFCGLPKAFYYVNHNTLLYKLNFYRITGKGYAWIKSYFGDRYHRVEIKIPIIHIKTREL
jgi:hypothetical protein